MGLTKEVTQSLAKLNIDTQIQFCVPAQGINPIQIPIRTSSRRFSHSLPVHRSGQTHNTEANPNDNNKGIKPESTSTPIAGPLTATNITNSPKHSPNNPPRKALKKISRNIAESLALHGKTHSLSASHIANGITKCREKMRMGVDKVLRREQPSRGLKRWLKEKERRRERRTHRGAGAISEGLRKRLGLRREGATLGSLGVIKEEEDVEIEEGLKMKDDVEVEEDTVMKD